jgi:hypothetical protein
MLLRKDGPGVIAVPRPCHARLSSQMARPSCNWPGFALSEIIASEAIRIGANFNHRPLLQELLNTQMLQSDSNS